MMEHLDDGSQYGFEEPHYTCEMCRQDSTGEGCEFCRDQKQEQEAWDKLSLEQKALIVECQQSENEIED